MTIRHQAASLVALFALASAASAETLLVDRVHQEPASLPKHGLSMAQVQAQFGAPTSRLDPRGGQKHQWPTINRWSYPGFTVYFERNKVIDAVANQVDADEIGPKPPVR